MKKWKNLKKLGSLVLVSLLMFTVLVGCAQNDLVEASTKEAPILAERVKNGELPPLEERIPVAADVMVEPDIISLGEYGGSVTITTRDSGRWTWGPYTEQSMFRFKQDGSGEVEPNVAKDFYSNEDGTVWTIELREGMRWSDGHPFTADDVIFYYDHMSTPALNPDRTPVAVDEEAYHTPFTTRAYNCYQTIKDGQTYWAEFEKIDDYKFTVTFAAPKPNFPEAVAVDNKWLFRPKHFYVNYVARKDGVTDEPNFPLITEQEALANANRDFNRQWDNYSTLGNAIGYYHWDYAIVPQLRSFIAVKDNWNQVGEVYELVRNPYFWKVDSEGRQLPYVDSIKVVIVNEAEQRTLKQAAGEFGVSEIEFADYSTVVRATQGTHSVVSWVSVDWQGGYGLALNQTTKDLDKRALFQDIRFREALSIAVDRNLMNNTLMNGQSSPQQAAPSAGTLGHHPEWLTKWTEYDVARANALLDELTEPWDQRAGTYRKMKGTNRDLEIIISIQQPSLKGDWLTLLQGAYEKIGVRVLDKVDPEVGRTILTNDVEAKFEGISIVSPAIRPDQVVPMRNFAAWYSAYGKWYADGRSTANGGIEPTGDVLALIDAYDAIKVAAGPNKDKIVAENVAKIYELHHKNIWVIGFLAPPARYWLVNNNVMNFPPGLVWSDEYRFASMMRPEQWYIAK